jgi:maltose/moltooligosaccharide transporter
MKTQKREKKALSFWQLWNMSLGFFGIQFGWTLQMANTSAIYEYLGAHVEEIPILWLAAPVSGLIAQPIIGYLSDRTWGFLGRRRPYFLVGAIISSIALILMPNSSTLWMAAGLLWVLDTSVNISMEPFRAFVTDLLPKKQQILGFSMQSFFIGSGAVIASMAPWLLNHFVGIENSTNNHSIPPTVKLSFYVGSVIFLGTVIWTVVTTKEHPPANKTALKQNQVNGQEFLDGLQDIFSLISKMPKTMKQLAWVQFFTWLGMFCIFLYFPPAVAHTIFGASDENSALYTNGIEWAGICIAVYNAVCVVFSLFLPKLTQISSRKITHSWCLLCGGLGIISLSFVRDPYLMLLSMACFGIAWASILSIPYAMLSHSLPAKNVGLYMGIFNAFIVIPQILASLGLGWVMINFLSGDRLLAVVLGGFSLVIAALLVKRVDENPGEVLMSLRDHGAIAATSK